MYIIPGSSIKRRQRRFHRRSSNAGHVNTEERKLKYTTVSAHSGIPPIRNLVKNRHMYKQMTAW